MTGRERDDTRTDHSTTVEEWVDDGAGRGVTATTADDSPVTTVPRLCGCAGKTSLSGVVYPARRRIATRLARTPVRLAGTVDAALLPRTVSLERRVTQGRLGGDDGGDGVDGERRFRPTDGSATDPTGTWVLGATFLGDELADVERFTEAVGEAYAGLGEGRAALAPGTRPGAVVGKAHSVQVPNAKTGRQWFEHLHPRGARRPGYWSANVDVVHAFPGLEPAQQAAVAVSHALNDCYAVGGTEDRRVRPLVAVPDGTTLAAETVSTWYEDGSPDGVTVDPASVVEHDGAGWLFGASAVGAVTRRPPVRAGRVEAGDEVLLHRSLGALSTYSLGVDSPLPAGVRERAVEALRADHVDVARAVASFSPALGERFDPARHVKFVTDVSGPGLDGLARSLAWVGPRQPRRLHLTALPLLDAETVERARERWVTPDVTVETNGPLAVVARPAVIDAVAERLSSLPDCEPVRIGEVRDGGETAGEGIADGRTTGVGADGATADEVTSDGVTGGGIVPRLTTAEGVDLGRYVERYLREGR